MKPGTSILLFLALPRLVLADCLSLGQARAGSACSPQAAEIILLEPQRTGEGYERRGSSIDRLIDDPAFRTGSWFQGAASFRLRAGGERLVEVFLMMPREVYYSVVLEVAGVPVDTRYRTRPGPGRMRPRTGLEEIALLALVRPGAAFTVRTEAPRYVVSAVRTTTPERFESELVPAYRERLLRILADPFVDGLRSSRRYPIEQLAARLLFSRSREIRREGAVGVARALYWEAAENHEPRDIERAGRALAEALRLAPDDTIVRQMISASCTGLNIGRGEMPADPSLCRTVKPVPWAVLVPPDPAGAPEWATAQRRLMRRSEAVTRWWVERRQPPNGELGGGWGDDVEILRSWGPLALGFGSAPAAEGLKRMADGLWSSGQLLNGYDRGISDVEHSSEPTTDTGPLRAAVAPQDAGALERLAETAACAFHWIVRQADERWRFRSSWFNCRECDARPERALDVHLNTRAMGPALWHAYFSRDPRLLDLLSRWGQSWVEAMRSEKHGKPAGIFPPVLRSSDGDFRIGSGSWDKPEAEWDYYQWSGTSQESLTSLVLALYDLTGERRWLDAAEESFRPLEQCEKHPSLCEQMRRAPEAFFEWRRLAGSNRFDRAFGVAESEGREAILRRMASAAREMENRLAHNFDMLTSEVIFTDRVYYQLPPEYRQRLFGGESPRGDRYPTFTVTWPAAGADFARAVVGAGTRSIELALYSFEPRPTEVPVQIWRLEKGRYLWESRDQAGRLLVKGAFVFENRPQTVRLPLPPRSTVFVSLRRTTG